MKYDPILCMMVEDKRTTDAVNGSVEKFYEMMKGKSKSEVEKIVMNAKGNPNAEAAYIKWKHSQNVNDSKSVFDKAIRSCDSVKVVYSDALGDNHTFIKESVEEAKKWIDSGKFPHGAAFNVKIDGVLYKKEAR